jgi:hypothetical protein
MTKSTATVSTVDTIALFKGIAAAHCGGLTALEVIKGHIATLRESGIKMGKSVKTCEFRTHCTDAYVAAFPKTAKKTISNYVTAVVAAVNDGVEFSFSASKGKGKGKKKSDADKTIFPVLAKLFSHEGFAALVSELQASYDNDEGSLSDLIRVTLESEGFVITE